MFNRFIFVRCSFRRGGFPGERVFSLRTPGGETWQGVAPTQYCLTEDLRPLGDDPAPGVEMDGKIAGLAPAPTPGGMVRVYLPDCEVYEVDERDVESAQLPGRSGQAVQSASVTPP